MGLSLSPMNDDFVGGIYNRDWLMMAYENIEPSEDGKYAIPSTWHYISKVAYVWWFCFLPEYTYVWLNEWIEITICHKGYTVT